MGTSTMKETKLKTMKSELNFLSKSDGSAILSQGDTVVLTSVNGPLEVKSQSQNMRKANLEVLFCSKGGVPSVSDRYKENIIKETCEEAILSSLYPRTGIIVTIQELEDYGGLISCAVNSTCLALLHSGVSMRSVCAAVWCVVDGRGELVLEPTRADNARAHFTFVFDACDRSVVTSFTEGSYSDDVYAEALARCREASGLVFKYYRDTISNYCNVIGG